MSNSHTTPLTLSGGQDRIRNQYITNDSGLFVLSCVPGAGKSTTVEDIAAEAGIDAYVGGASTPEEAVVVISFNQHEAETLIPRICDRVRELIEHDLTPQAAELSSDDAEYLTQRIRSAPHIGTVDAFLRSVFEDFSTQLGFESMPTVGEAALLGEVHADCYREVKSTYGKEIRELEGAYPVGEYDADVSEILEQAITYCRDRGITPAQFCTELEETRSSVYPTGRPDSADDLKHVLHEWLGVDGIPVTDNARSKDVELYDRWGVCLSQFETVCAAYLETYQEKIREHGVVSHTDIAYLVAAYFAASTSSGVDMDFGGSIPSTFVDEYDNTIVKRHRERYNTAVSDILIDEAQDISAAQHTALSYLFAPGVSDGDDDSDSDRPRVFLSGDLQQNIYTWRHADPSIFEAAINDGEFFGASWQTHVSETASTTYRARPDIAALVNTIAQPIFNDPVRGDIGDLAMSSVTTPIESNREQTSDPNVHIPVFAGDGHPGSQSWVAPSDGVGEADSVASYLVHAFDAGAFTDDDGEQQGVTVLFRRRTRMADYERVFAEHGLQVENASEPLFDSGVIEFLCTVCEWLVNPLDESHLNKLRELSVGGMHECLTDDPGLEAYLRGDVPIDEVADTNRVQEVGRSLKEVLSYRDQIGRQPISDVLHSIINALSLGDVEGLGVFAADAKQRRADLDRFIDLVSGWEDDTPLALTEVLTLIDPLRDSPKQGPLQPSVVCDADSVDVVFKTIHSMKGDEDDVIVLADSGFSLWWPGVQSKRFVASGDVVGLAPPTDVSSPNLILPGIDGGLYTPSESGYSRDVGLRWATEHWGDYITGDSSMSGEIVGSERLTTAVRTQRAESWRLLYVALTRARDHLVIPLPNPSTYTANDPRDRWVDTLLECLGMSGCDENLAQTDTYTLDTPYDPNTDSVDVAVYSPRTASTEQQTPHPDSTKSPNSEEKREHPLPDTGESVVESWIPRFVAPNTIYPITEDPEAYQLDHILGRKMDVGGSEISDSVTLDFDALDIDPTDVGTICHAVLSVVIDNGYTEPQLRSLSPPVRNTISDVVNGHLPSGCDSGSASQIVDSVTQFIDEYLFPQFLTSDVWGRIQRADRVLTDKPVSGCVEIDGGTAEIFGEIDVVTVMPDGTWHISDFKISFADSATKELHKRYELQVAAYAYLLDQEEEGSIRQTVEVFGHHRETVRSEWPLDVVERRLVTAFGQ